MSEPPKEYRFLYINVIQQAKKTFGEHFTSKLEIAPHWEEFEVARLPLKDQDEKFDSLLVCLTAAPAVFMCVYMLKEDKKVMAIGTRSGRVKELWDMVRPIIEMEANGDIGIEFFGIVRQEDDVQGVE